MQFRNTPIPHIPYIFITKHGWKKSYAPDDMIILDHLLKVGLSPSKKICVICFIENPLKMMRNACYVMLKALFVLVMTFCHDFLVM